jgi:hypothetical protein
MLIVSALDWLEYLLIEKSRVLVRSFVWGPVFDWLGPKWFYKLGLIDIDEARSRKVAEEHLTSQWFSARKPGARG